MTEAKAPDLTPPNKKSAKAEKGTADGVVKEPKPKKEKAVADPNAPKKERAPRTNYGYHSDAVLSIVPGKEIKYRGHRLAWYESLKGFDGKTVKDWEASRKGEKDPPRGWLRFFVQDGTVALTPPAVEQKAA